MTAPPSTMRAPTPTDAELLRRFRDGDDASFAALYERYRHRLKTYATRMVGRVQDAEDITTEVFVRLVDRRLDVDGHSSLRGLLFTVVHRLSIDRIRRWQRRARLLGWFARRAEEPPESAEDLLVLGQRDARLQEAVARLAPKHRAVVLLTYTEALTSREVADILHCTDQQVRSKLAYARRLLRDELGDVDG